jgi:hypothetical protein
MRYEEFRQFAGKDFVAEDDPSRQKKPPNTDQSSSLMDSAELCWERVAPSPINPLKTALCEDRVLVGPPQAL